MFWKIVIDKEQKESKDQKAATYKQFIRCIYDGEYSSGITQINICIDHSDKLSFQIVTDSAEAKDSLYSELTKDLESNQFKQEGLTITFNPNDKKNIARLVELLHEFAPEHIDREFSLLLRRLIFQVISQSPQQNLQEFIDLEAELAKFQEGPWINYKKDFYGQAEKLLIKDIVEQSDMSVWLEENLGRENRDAKLESKDESELKKACSEIARYRSSVGLNSLGAAGKGGYAIKTIPAGVIIVEYEGKLIDVENSMPPKDPSYSMRIKDRMLIRDAKLEGGRSRFFPDLPIKCPEKYTSANLEIVFIGARGFLKTTREINAGEILGYPYGSSIVPQNEFLYFRRDNWQGVPAEIVHLEPSLIDTLMSNGIYKKLIKTKLISLEEIVKIHMSMPWILDALKHEHILNACCTNDVRNMTAIERAKNSALGDIFLRYKFFLAIQRTILGNKDDDLPFLAISDLCLLTKQQILTVIAQGLTDRELRAQIKSMQAKNAVFALVVLTKDGDAKQVDQLLQKAVEHKTELAHASVSSQRYTGITVTSTSSQQPKMRQDDNSADSKDEKNARVENKDSTSSHSTSSSAAVREEKHKDQNKNPGITKETLRNFGYLSVLNGHYREAELNRKMADNLRLLGFTDSQIAMIETSNKPQIF